MELCEGMYVRTKKRTLQPSQIARIRNMSKDSGYKNQYYIELDKNLIPSYEYHIYEEDILKVSHNLIDLIEVGDYVNGSKVIRTNCKLEYIDDDSDTGVDEVYNALELENGWIYFEHEIEDIVTKEQFESMAYKVVE